ncbi:zinc finger protein 197 isoform X2 [Triplophysa rosa]|uniref:zinc finger protein 197 isoform X2 n=1 Tax=Triplophysa rosa TaxID=992332 RepID=UPI00254603C0|nr:zinc finger protein 197 isoform X2 [Triplophysa rosa]
MSSEFTLDIQLTELGFSSWDFPLCEPQSVKETFLPTQNSIEKSSPGTPKSHEDASIVPSGSAENSVLQDHQYSSPVKQNSTIITEKPQDGLTAVNVEDREKIIFNKWKVRKRRTFAEGRNSDREQSREDDTSTNEKEESEETNSLQIDDHMSVEEKTDEDVEFALSDDDDDQEDEEEEEEEEEEELDDDISCSETPESGEIGENYCHVCDATFPTLFLLREHLNMHTGVRPYRCDECSKQFCQLVNYRAHLRSHSQKASIHCKVCSTIFETEEQLQKHLDSNHFEDEFYQCDFCKQIFTDLEVCQDHVDKHRQQAKRHMCLKCGSSFRKRKSLLRHLEGHSRGVFSCSDCDRTYSSKASLLRHSFSHSGLLPYTCLKCKRHFRLPSLYRNHDCKPEHIQCMACLVFFQSSEDFDKHKKDTGCWGHQGAMSSTTDEIRCMECGQVCASVEELKQHGSTHQRVLKCAECGMGFRSSLMLMSHMGGHAAQRPCLCKDCGLGFPHQQGYDSHLKTCGLVTPPVPTTKKPKPKEISSPQQAKLIIPNVVFQTVGQDSNLITLSHNKVAHVIPLGDQKQPADGVWKFTLPKDPPPGIPLVMILPVPASQSLSTSDPTKISQNILPSSLVLKTPSPAPCVISMPVVPTSPVICKEAQKDNAGQSRTNIPANILIPMEGDNGTARKTWTILEDKKSNVGKQAADVVVLNQGCSIRLNVTAHSEAEGEQKSLKNQPNTLISDEKHENVKDSDSSLVLAEAEEIAFDKGQLKNSSEDQRLCKETVQEGNMCDVEVEVDQEVEIGDEDSGVDISEGELHECVTCGQVLPEKDMIQHFMKHAAVSDSPNKCATHTTDHSPSCSPSRKRQRSETEL